MIHEFFECSSNIPSGLSISLYAITKWHLLLLYSNSEDAWNSYEFTGAINSRWMTNQFVYIVFDI